jgi:hypothetical protein
MPHGTHLSPIKARDAQGRVLAVPQDRLIDQLIEWSMTRRRKSPACSPANR